MEPASSISAVDVRCLTELMHDQRLGIGASRPMPCRHVPGRTTRVPGHASRSQLAIVGLSARGCQRLDRKCLYWLGAGHQKKTPRQLQDRLRQSLLRLRLIEIKQRLLSSEPRPILVRSVGKRGSSLTESNAKRDAALYEFSTALWLRHS